MARRKGASGPQSGRPTPDQLKLVAEEVVVEGELINIEGPRTEDTRRWSFSYTFEEEDHPTVALWRTARVLQIATCKLICQSICHHTDPSQCEICKVVALLLANKATKFGHNCGLLAVEHPPFGLRSAKSEVSSTLAMISKTLGSSLSVRNDSTIRPCFRLLILERLRLSFRKNTVLHHETTFLRLSTWSETSAK